MTWTAALATTRRQTVPSINGLMPPLGLSKGTTALLNSASEAFGSVPPLRDRNRANKLINAGSP